MGPLRTKIDRHSLGHNKTLRLYMLCSETIVQKFPSQQVNLAAQYQLLRRGSTALLRVQTNGKFNRFPKFPITREPLEIQTIPPEKYLTYTNELGYDGHMLPILINYTFITH